MNPSDDSLAQLFAQDEPNDSEAFVAAVRKRIDWRRRTARTLELGAGAAIIGAAVAVAAIAPELVLYPVQLVQSVLGSPLGATACALGAIGLGWWIRYGDA